MEILYCGKRNESLSFKKEVKCYTWNSLYLNRDSYEVMYAFDSKLGTYKNGFYYVKGNVSKYSVYEKGFQKGCTHILLSDSEIDKNWAFSSLKRVIKSDDRVCICALSFFDDTKTERDWNVQFKEGQGFLFRLNNDIFYKYGLKKEQITWINYFKDSKEEMLNKLQNSSVVYFPGGAPELLMKRIKECKLKRILKNYQGTMIGVSAGAMVQLDDYHITPDDEYPTFQYLKGLGCMNSFDIEVHYQANNHQRKYIQKVLEEKKKPIYALYETGGLIVKESVSMFGKVEVFECE